MALKPDDIDDNVLADLNIRTLVNGAAVPQAVIAASLGLSISAIGESLARLRQLGYVSISPGGVTLTPEGKEHLH